MSTSRRLPRGRSALPLEEVARVHRERLCRAMADVMAEKGYIATSVEDVLKRAKVSRQSFYRLFGSKLDCFMAALERSSGLISEWVIGSVATDSDPLARYDQAIGAYLQGIELEWASARLCLVEAYAAGPAALAHRREMQAAIADIHAAVLGVTGERGLRACRMLAASTVALVTLPVAENDREALLGLRPEMVAHVRALWNAGVFGAA
ncbi:TetR/AcrR family transcriptional regulator [Spirillospora albida]|uniref:TetR/AcrR family transcriptional regulator n=1 Tax=Spirillospora albida TaxID=58123 RepID=UPI0004BF2FA7|nr:TetR/AcrR family transcriptional regulator [Spirillospora albida]